MQITLYEEHLKRVFVNVTAEVENNKLKILGQDLGKACSEVFGDDEYEYSYNFDEENTTKLLYALKADADISELLVLLKTNFSGINCCKMLREFCEKNDIIYTFYSC